MITPLTDELRLYHGSYCRVTSPDLGKCAAHKDFGRGFYLTSDREQARSFAKISATKAIHRKIISPGQAAGYVSVFRVHGTAGLSVRVYEETDSAWLRMIVGHRIGTGQEVPYDVIAGKIADDTTNATLLAYMSGLYGEVGTKEAEETCIRLLLPERLKDQFCFRTEQSIRALDFLEAEPVWL